MRILKIPCVAVGAVIFENNKILLVRRKNPPAQGQWAIPGGKVRWGETLKEALKREMQEEIQVEIRPEALLKVVEIMPEGTDRDFHYVILDYKATIIKGQPKAGDDAAEVAWFTKEQLADAPLTESTRQLLQETFKF